MRVAIRVDAGPLIGGGHVMRCLTLADALGRRGASTTFVSASMPESLEARVRASGHDLLRITPSPELDRSGAGWHEPPLSEEAQARDAELTVSACGTVDWLIVDHYLLDAHWHRASRRVASRLLVIDDLANRPYDCDVLVDQTFGRAAADYRPHVPAAAKVLAGSLYALLRPEFAERRAAALTRRETEGQVQRILVTMGTTDPGGISSRMTEAALDAAPECMVDVVLGTQAADTTGLAERNNVKVHVDSKRMSEIMLEADVALGAAGATSWERCSLGLPSIALVLAENQRNGAVALESAGAAIAVDSVDEAGPELSSLVENATRRARMSAAAFAIVDGLGAARVVEQMIGGSPASVGKPRLRPAMPEDSRTLWLWRNDPQTRSQSRNKEPIVWGDHARWFAQRAGENIFIAEHGRDPVGSVRFDQGDDGVEVSIGIAPERRGMGLGSAILSAACAQSPGSPIIATVRQENEASIRLFEGCGFEQIESGEPGFMRYVLPVKEFRRGHA